eukprot:1126142-Pleurochrysis_carterae.AAC.1
MNMMTSRAELCTRRVHAQNRKRSMRCKLGATVHTRIAVNEYDASVQNYPRRFQNSACPARQNDLMLEKLHCSLPFTRRLSIEKSSHAPLPADASRRFDGDGSPTTCGLREGEGTATATPALRAHACADAPHAALLCGDGGRAALG